MHIVLHARQYALACGKTKKHKIIARAPSYHGSTMGAFSASDDVEMKENFQSLTKISIKVPAPLSYRIPDNFDASSYARFCLDALERTIADEDPEEVLANTSSGSSSAIVLSSASKQNLA